ncbi:hypothetical protein SAMN05444172_8938 [Burkholderia sp. GAS332]|nr:hypothetical protein SAMN05444172_8938 [Burkholderia sp. GAS332]
MDSYYHVYGLEMVRKTRSGRDILEEQRSLREVRADITTRDDERGDPSMKKVFSAVLPGPDAGATAARSSVIPFGLMEAGFRQRRNGGSHEDGSTLLSFQAGKNTSSLWRLNDAAGACNRLPPIRKLQIHDALHGFPAHASIKPNLLMSTLKGQTYWLDSFFSGVLSDAGWLPQDTPACGSA